MRRTNEEVSAYPQAFFRFFSGARRQEATHTAIVAIFVVMETS
jgi:hypothetical protein